MWPRRWQVYLAKLYICHYNFCFNTVSINEQCRNCSSVRKSSFLSFNFLPMVHKYGTLQAAPVSRLFTVIISRIFKHGIYLLKYWFQTKCSENFVDYAFPLSWTTSVCHGIWESFGALMHRILEVSSSSLVVETRLFIILLSPSRLFVGPYLKIPELFWT